MTKKQLEDHLKRECRDVKRIVENIEFAALLSDKEENIVALSRDAIEKLISVIQYATLCNKNLTENKEKKT